MIIKQLTLHNFGVYAGTNVFQFSNEKPIVLIGGMNGRGKTTFLEAILISLYGANSIAYKESRYHSYNQYLRSFVNKNDWTQECYIELEFFMNESTSDLYKVRREWNALSRITRENIFVWQNGVESDFLAKNWAMFVENILPSALSSFYFFDGEKIAELAVDDTNKQMKESIRAMLGLTVLDVLKNDIGRILKKIGKNVSVNDSGEALELLREERDSAIAQLKNIDEKIEDLNCKIEEAQIEIENLHREYETQGGVVLEQQQKLMQNRANIKNALSQNQEALVNLAAGELPLVLVKDLIMQIKLQAEDEHNDFIMRQALEQMDLYLDFFEEDRNKPVDESRSFIEFIKNMTQKEAVESIYSMSDQALFQVNELVESALIQSVKNVKEKIEQKKKLCKEKNEIDSYLSLDINDKQLSATYKKIKREEDKLVQLKVKLTNLQHERSNVNAVVIKKTAEFNRDVENYLQKVELHDDDDRMDKYLRMAIVIVDAYNVELQKRKTGALGRTITECYKKLANKKNLIQEIIMDPETLDITYLDENNCPVSKNSLSAGEKQLMVIAILWALALCSKKKLPVIIDTPLSRLDSQHRTAIITTYFPNASDQTIILSTDTEIDQNYYTMMRDFVGDEYTLNYDEETKSTSILRGYF